MGLDPNYLYDNADVLWYGTEGYQNALSALMKVSGKSEQAVELMLNGQYGAADYWTAMEALKDSGVVTAYNTNGYRCFAYADDVVMTAPSGPITQIDSNATTTTLVKAAPAYDVVLDAVPSSPTYGKVLTNPIGKYLNPAHGFYGWKFFAGECLQAVSAASVGITLGKTFDSTLYNLFPNFFDANGMWAFNPETWGTITNGDDSFAAGLFNMVFGIDPNTGNSQAFIDENAMAYLAYYMKTQGVFDATQTVVTFDTEELDYNLTHSWKSPVLIYNTNGSVILHDYRSGVYDDYLTYSSSGSASIYTIGLQGGTNTISLVMFISEQPFTVTRINPATGSTTTYQSIYENGTANYPSFYYWTLGGGGDYYQMTPPIGGRYTEVVGSNPSNCGNVHADGSYWQSSTNQESRVRDAAIILFGGGDIQTSGGIDGIGNQDGATLPDVSNWNDIPSTLQALQNQYPSLWDNAVPNTIVQPDGSTQTITYVPVAMPNANGQWDSQPTSGTSTQANPQVQPQPNPTPENNNLLKLLLQLVTMPEPQPDTETQPQTQPQPDIPNMPNTGDGESPTPLPPSGSASALWSVYHPTQSQVNAFGGWLWGSVFTTDIRKLFTDPIQGVISLHKIFATPVDSGSGTIVVGTLDSNVPSATVTQQYVTVDCGSVDCAEMFGTVFDYEPYTQISCYLPFIGIVPLKTDDVMRSTIHITYGVDIFTGACLAMIEVIRDGNTVNMYQYSGVASVEYPLTNLQQSNIISGLLSVAGGVAMAVGSGGVGFAAGAAMIGGAASAAKSSVGRSGGFSGNSGAMGIKIPYLIIERPQTKVAETFPYLAGYPTNYSCTLSDCSGHVTVKHVHIEGINATDSELKKIESILMSGVIV